MQLIPQGKDMSSLVSKYKKYGGWFWRHKVTTVVLVLFLIIVTVNVVGNMRSKDNQAATDTSSAQNDGNTPQPDTAVPSTTSTAGTAQNPPAKPSLRQDLAFQGDAAYCDGIYKDNGNGTTTWSYDIKQDGELITHLSDNSGHTYRHDVKITDAPNYYAYTAPVAIKDVAEINGVLNVASDGSSHPCNLSPQQQPQQTY